MSRAGHDDRCCHKTMLIFNNVSIPCEGCPYGIKIIESEDVPASGVVKTLCEAVENGAVSVDMAWELVETAATFLEKYSRELVEEES